eukprot:c2489_g1_i1.p1 GENE.c2489_g1_i1~~c2489_g1_i1.p1  ORF type:complete len:358 (-),score=63.68 c2489_g1_i1:17-1090(-)
MGEDSWGVASLSQSHSLVCVLDLGVAAPIAQETDAPPMDQDYLENNWVNEEAGYFAVCGKMSADEELEMILAVISAFDGPTEAKNLPEVDSSTVKPPTPTTAPQSLLDDPLVQDHMRVRPFLEIDQAQPRIFNSFELCSDMGSVMSNLNNHGFVFVRLQPGVHQAVQAVLDDARKFFELPVSEKSRLRDPHERYFGYVHNELYRKELVQIRQGSPNRFESAFSAIQNSIVDDFRQSTQRAYESLFDLARAFVTSLLVHMGAPLSYVQTLIEPACADASFGDDVSRTNLTVFRYWDRLSVPLQFCARKDAWLRPSHFNRDSDTENGAILAGDFMEQVSRKRVSSNFLRQHGDPKFANT